MLKDYSLDIIHGLKCQHRGGRGSDYLVFIGEDFLGRKIEKWWIYSVGKSTQCELFHFHGKKHSQGVSGKAHELMAYIAKHECYERGLIPPFYHKGLELASWNNILSGTSICTEQGRPKAKYINQEIRLGFGWLAKSDKWWKVENMIPVCSK
jgi:hypothetical protein